MRKTLTIILSMIFKVSFLDGKSIFLKHIFVTIGSSRFLCNECCTLYHYVTLSYLTYLRLQDLVIFFLCWWFKKLQSVKPGTQLLYWNYSKQFRTISHLYRQLLSLRMGIIHIGHDYGKKGSRSSNHYVVLRAREKKCVLFAVLSLSDRI